MKKRRFTVCTRMILMLGIAGVIGFQSVGHAQEEPSIEPLPSWLTPKKFDKVAPHPRLFISAGQLQRAVAGRGEDYAAIYERIEKAALTGVREADDPIPDHNMMRRQIWIIGRLQAMAIQYHRTGDKQYIEASVKTIENMESWFTGMWQLWHGGYCTAIATSYDLLHEDMTPEQRKRVVDFARKTCIYPFLERTARGKNRQRDGESGSWWQGIISNWNPVCNSGAGLLAIAMYDELDVAQTVIDRVDASFDPIIEYLQETEGGWVEGLGYWNWTMHYMSVFYMSYERAFGVEHEGFRSPGFRKTLTFVEYFVPYDEACGFGDNQHGNISYSLSAAAERMGDTDALKRLQYYRQRYNEVRDAKQAIRDQRDPDRAGAEQEDDGPYNIGYGTTHHLLVNPDSLIAGKPQPATEHLLHKYPKQGWIALADRWPKPNVYAAIRAGQLGGAHTQDDLLTWHGIIGNEVMIQNIYKGHVSQNSYGRRRNELFEVSSRSKNSLFVGGLGPTGSRGNPAKANTAQYKLPIGPMVVLEATGAMNTTRNRPRFVARAFLTINDKALLVIDRVVSPSGGGQPVEVRTFTPRDATFGDTDVLLEGEFQTARMTFASNVEATLTEAVPLMTFPRNDTSTMMRWRTNDTEKSPLIASLMSSGADPVDMTIDLSKVPAPEGDGEVDGPITITIQAKDWSEQIKLTSRLEPINGEKVGE